MRDKTRQRRARMENSNDSSGAKNALPSQDEWVWSIVSEKPSVREIIETDCIATILYFLGLRWLEVVTSCPLHQSRPS